MAGFQEKIFLFKVAVKLRIFVAFTA